MLFGVGCSDYGLGRNVLTTFALGSDSLSSGGLKSALHVFSGTFDIFFRPIADLRLLVERERANDFRGRAQDE